ncbi:phospholipase D-like domain-containing protein DpdK [Paraburkholderia caballeronis]|uniref:phospholipase D-like domain-containing protein DpdK n=1 Tax=Paraburkholderia caballeronis TaxID=416943 RepID=UPI0010648B92|nr:phospholipase D-like domain-containing protein DpdK [Paraburkholderia caballeronis]TDV02653.1 phospholipase D-like protein [Paraburkholderia caballeronis]TDV06866.1 phospholipase D-like protein [Paraburkholderia caballeronis]TDV17019.1 phospholipase D-like protein [Paraburkholderia caballeronis]
MNIIYRRIFKTQTTGVTTIQELLQTMFVAEVLQPGDEIWIVSPWISNVVLIDNRSGCFDALNPEWGRREIRLADVLATLMNHGTKVHIVTRSEASNDAFRSRIADVAREHDLEDQLAIHIHDQLHTKGILLTRCLLMGSMNLTYYGMVINDEWVEFSLDPHDHGRTRLEFARYAEAA